MADWWARRAPDVTAFAGATVLSEQQVLAVRDLSVHFMHERQRIDAVRRISFDVQRGETLAIVGESGSGKSVTALSVMRLLALGGGKLDCDAMLFRRRNGQVVNLATAGPSTLRMLRGADMAMIFQEPMTSLNPVFPVGEQIAESIRLHQGKDHRQSRQEALSMLERVRIPNAQSMLDRYPHQLSGGMRQRVMIAMALSCKPALLIADEPTTALDVTIQAQILQLIRTLQREMQMGVIFITHDMGVVAEMADRVMVMYRGDDVESAPVQQLFAHPEHDYTRALLAAVPKLGALANSDFPEKFPLTVTVDPASASAGLPTPPQDTVLAGALPILQVRDLVTGFDLRSGILNRVRQRVHAVEKVSFSLYPGETLALVGESGCGKSTTGRALLRLVESQSGDIIFNGQSITALRGHELQRLRRNIQFIFQDPYASLDPRLTVGYSIMEPLLVHGVAQGADAQRRVARLLERVGLLPEHAQRYPHEFSGGQRQRICIARALALNPKVVIADESVSALDVSIQAQIINLMLDLQREFGIAFLFISHDMAVVERISHRVAVMYLGQIVEIGPRRQVLGNPQHPYTRKLMSAVPIPDPTRRLTEHAISVDEMPSPIRALGDEPRVAPLVEVGAGHYVARHHIGGAY
ncbi:dipeptide ABC transporter ATP-binding protein [Acerihabitans sp. TG2]|uniref:dipeptide ABC transporter ATP-binding protein n=1 Tax=Acerihabitans sp. TG2 TaxID=3096008 RepID=UPI002B233EE1|nr:dipeptide ABC transporter ATP-binding protein [Acerihabitans sp. TG2]MEA9390594.1 dipeptide ABC transporter ATP-binding protein [Acerihabitans sp. TG2]